MWISNPQPLFLPYTFLFCLWFFLACFACSCMPLWRIVLGWWELSHENAKAENLSLQLCHINFIRGLGDLQNSSFLPSGQDKLCSTFLAPEFPLGIRLKFGFSYNLFCLVSSPTYPAFPHFLICFCLRTLPVKNICTRFPSQTLFLGKTHWNFWIISLL